MEKITQLMTSSPIADQDIVVLRCPDQLHFDPAPLKHLFQHKSALEAEEIICRLLEDIALRLDLMQSDLAGSQFAKLLKPATQISNVSDQIGLTEVSISAAHVATCLRQRDGVALEATMARLERAFDVAVSEVWNFRDR